MTHSHHVQVSIPDAYSHSHHHVSTMPAASPAMTHSRHHSGGHHHHHHHHGQPPAALPGFPVPYAYPPPALASTTAVAPVLQPTRANSNRDKMTTGERICMCLVGLLVVGFIANIIFVFVSNWKYL
ncbi:forkhead box protein G1 [Triticum aestivum]|uniref:forkhead box protein G1 n=1 Tax=Triticum aestivum TaxID=4565 RepID=UPI001D0200E3|nr:forkhead box protein G1-like [Triticum aestivum]